MAEDTLTWSQQLRAARNRFGITRKQLARLSGVSASALRSWEEGSRHATLEGLDSVLDALDCPSGIANEILVGAGFAPSRTLFTIDRFPNYFYALGELRQAVEEMPWPEFVLNSNVEVVAANSAIQKVWRVDYAQDWAGRTGAQLSIWRMASDRNFADRCVNWEEVVGTLAGAFKGRPKEALTPDDFGPYAEQVLAQFLGGDPAFLRRLLEVFAETPAREPKCRWTYRVVWRDDEFGDMRFMSIVGTASEPDGLSFNDWIPQDAATWETLERVKSRHNVQSPRR
jgi:transcriptional regulator with XRE-family HTH domain